MSDFQPSQLPDPNPAKLDHNPAKLDHPALLERNPVTHKAHRREVLWQITVPLVVGIVAVLALAFLAARGATNDVSRWADISLIWLILPTLLIAFIFLIVVGAIAFGIVWLVRKLPVPARRAQDLVASLGAQVGKITDAAVEPILRAQSFSASMQALRRSLRRETRRGV